jgi:hypothetical protein
MTEIMHPENNVNKPIRTVHQHTPRKTLHGAKADAKSGKTEIRSVPSVEKVSQHQGQVECEEGRKRKQGTKSDGLKAATEMTMIKENEKKTDKYFVILCRRNIQLRASSLLAAEYVVRHYLTLGLRSGNVEWEAFPVITEARIKLPEKYKLQTESRATFNAPLGTKCQPESELTVFLGCLMPKINALRSSETSENIQDPSSRPRSESSETTRFGPT